MPQFRHDSTGWRIATNIRRTGGVHDQFIHPDDSHCYRALHSVHAIFMNENNVLTARTDQPDGRWQEFEIKGFELLEPGRVYG